MVTYNSANYEDQNGNEWVVGGTLTFPAGGAIVSPPAGIPGIILPASTLNIAGAGTGTFKDSGNISTQLSAAGVGTGADTTEDTLFTYTLPASTLDAAGRGLLINAFGKLGASGNNKTIKVYFGTSVVFNSGTQTGNNVGWDMTLMVYKTGANTQIGQGTPIFGATHGGVTLPLSGSENDSAAVVIKVTGTNGTAAANHVLCYGMIIESFN